MGPSTSSEATPVPRLRSQRRTLAMDYSALTPVPPQTTSSRSSRSDLFAVASPRVRTSAGVTHPCDVKPQRSFLSRVVHSLMMNIMYLYFVETRFSRCAVPVYAFLGSIGGPFLAVWLPGRR